MSESSAFGSRSNAVHRNFPSAEPELQKSSVHRNFLNLHLNRAFGSEFAVPNQVPHQTSAALLSSEINRAFSCPCGRTTLPECWNEFHWPPDVCQFYDQSLAFPIPDAPNNAKHVYIRVRLVGPILNCFRRRLERLHVYENV